MDATFLPASAQALAGSILSWFAAHRRPLPWREHKTPYRVWLSEVMLQQTQVAVVEGYYRRFLARFPDVHALARASEDDVLSLWSGLGYYSRGRNLLRAARMVVDQYGGVFPSRSDVLARLPGVGPYTAAAVASLAANEPIAVVDGNVARVVARLTNDPRPVDGALAKEAIRVHAQALVDASGDPGMLNEALMELGALVCTPRAASCQVCPWRAACAAQQAGTVAMLPVKLPKKTRQSVHVAVVVVTDPATRGIWLERRTARGLYGGLYEPPSREFANDVESAWRELLTSRNLPLPHHWPAPIIVERTLTHRLLTFAVLRVDVESAQHSGPWIEDIEAVGVSRAVRVVLERCGLAGVAVSGSPHAGRGATARFQRPQRAPPSSLPARQTRRFSRNG